MFYSFNLFFICAFTTLLYIFYQTNKQFTLFNWYNSLSIIFLLNLIYLLFSTYLNYNDSIFIVYFFNSFYYSIGIDKFSFLFLILLSFLFSICFIYNIKNIIIKSKIWLFSLISIFIALLFTFISQDLLTFFIGFEFVLIPLFWIVIEFGSRSNKIFAAFFIVILTLFGSCFFLIGFFSIFLEISSLNFNFLSFSLSYLSESRQSFIWIFLFLGLMVKVPLIPLHLWLPEAHGEAPTVGSVLLAGVVLKLGTYGLIRCLVFLFSNVEVFIGSILFAYGFLNMVFAALISIRQLDIKKAIAYGSIAHIGTVVIGLSEVFNFSEFGSVIIIIFHGLVSPLLFFLVGSLYDRFGTRNIYYFGSLALISPLFSVNWFLAVLGNVAFPGTGSFVGEITIFISLLFMNPFCGILLVFATFANLAWNFLLITRVVFLHYQINYLTFFYDISLKEFVIFLLLNILSIFSGLFAFELSSFLEYGFYYI
uniref:NADH-ubiquinone oxidoreductase chain 4 n=1 Tax=Pedinomonas minor TaxID=3159 RepID=Q9ZY24_PEDMN|nr:NADH dehydrogenase subunit 4 [Pedinomonas minor]AAD19670.1 NADH dehydrogenase subunit 4 [Pedinomonas minor]